MREVHHPVSISRHLNLKSKNAAKLCDIISIMSQRQKEELIDEVEKFKLLEREFSSIIWGYSPVSAEQYLEMLASHDQFTRSRAAGELLLHGSWKLCLTLLGGVEGIVAVWPIVKGRYARNRFTERMYRDIEWVQKYVERKNGIR